MKIVCTNKNMYVIYLSKYYYQYNKDTIADCIRDMLIYLKKNYDFEIYSEIYINCYINDNYGIILEISKKYDSYLLYIKKSNIEMICYYDSKVLYEVDDFFIKNNLSSYNIYIKGNKYYIELLNDDYLKIIEFTNSIIYGNKVKSIVNNSV